METQLENAAEVLVIGLAQADDAEAFAELVRRRQSWIRNLLRRLCHDQTLADDLAQQVFLQAWRDLVKLREASKFAGWLKRIAINTWLKHQRSNDPLGSALSEEAEQTERVTGSHPDMAMDLDAALATLPEQPRVCVVLAYHEGMSHPEIAQILNLPLGTVKSHIHRGTQRLRSVLHDYQTEK